MIPLTKSGVLAGARRFARAARSTNGTAAGISDDREGMARMRDKLATERDRVATVRDSLADAREKQRDEAERGSARTQAAEDRRTAALERAAAALDREHAARDRRFAAADRDYAAAARFAAGTDDLTGALHRGVGLAAVQREIDRAHRTKDRLVVAFVDVDGLKEVNDSRGHPAGDRLLKRAAESIGARMRPYDLIVRVGGDEFVCSLHGIDVEGARERFDLVAADLAIHPDTGSISVGLAELRAGDELDDVVLRADMALLAQRGVAAGRSRRARRTPPPTHPAEL